MFRKCCPLPPLPNLFFTPIRRQYFLNDWPLLFPNTATYVFGVHSKLPPKHQCQHVHCTPSPWKWRRHLWMALRSSSNSGRNGNNVPPERAFHSAHIMGNYMLVFGGYSHKHNEVENCYDQHIYFFHLGCHTWVSQRILEHSPQGRAYPKKQG